MDIYAFGLILFAMFGVLVLALSLVPTKGIKAIEVVCKFLKEVIQMLLF